MIRLFVFLACFMAIAGCFPAVTPPPETHSESDPSLPQLLEGLPHHFDASFAAEKQRDDVKELHGYWFYSTSVEIDNAEFQDVTRILQAAGTFKKWTGEKLCDGFHPDWLVQPSGSDGPVTYMICFGCHEAKVIATGTETRYDLSDAAYSGLARLLIHKRINRPEAKGSGNYLQ